MRQRYLVSRTPRRGERPSLAAPGAGRITPGAGPSRGPRRRFKRPGRWWVELASLLTGALVVFTTGPARADEPKGEEALTHWENPFAPTQPTIAGRFVANAHVASFAHDGIGVAAGYAPIWGFEVKLAYTYRTQNTFSALVKYDILPRAALTPYVFMGGTYALAKLKYDVSISSTELFGGLGLQARVEDRYFLGVELAATQLLKEIISDGRSTFEGSPQNAFDLTTGFEAGVYLP